MAARHKGLALLGLLLSIPILAVACSSGPGTGRPVSLLADDGLILQGRAYGGGAPGVILVHDFDSSQGAWSSLAETLAARGFLVLTYDLRGHSASPGDKDVSQTNADLSAAVRVMRTGFSRPLLFLVGEGLGGTAALNVAAVEKVLGVVTVSAPTTFRGVGGLNAATRVTAPKLFIAAEEDPTGADSARAYLQRAVEPKELALFSGDLSGAKLVDDDPRARDRILQFLDAHKSTQGG